MKTKATESVLNETQREMIEQVKSAVRDRINRNPRSLGDPLHALILGMDSAIRELEADNSSLFEIAKAIMDNYSQSGPKPSMTEILSLARAAVGRRKSR